MKQREAPISWETFVATFSEEEKFTKCLMEFLIKVSSSLLPRLSPHHNTSDRKLGDGLLTPRFMMITTGNGAEVSS
jgi:hypothetical protein